MHDVGEIDDVGDGEIKFLGQRDFRRPAQHEMRLDIRRLQQPQQADTINGARRSGYGNDQTSRRDLRLDRNSGSPSARSRPPT